MTRRLVLTGGALLERRPASYEVAERRQLAALAAVVRFAAEPTWLGLEWTDGAPAAMYVLPGRDALLAALLDAAQVCFIASLYYLNMPCPTQLFSGRSCCLRA